MTDLQGWYEVKPRTAELLERAAALLYGHKFQAWAKPRTEQERKGFEDAVKRGDLHPTCSSCSKDNTEDTSRLAHDRWQLKQEIEQYLRDR